MEVGTAPGVTIFCSPPCKSFTVTLAACGLASSLLFRAMASVDSCVVFGLRNSVSPGNSKTKSPPSEPGRMPNAGVWFDTLDTAGAT